MKLQPGQQLTYYPRTGKPGHLVTILEVKPHHFHRYFVRFQYPNGRIRQVSLARFFISPDD